MGLLVVIAEFAPQISDRLDADMLHHFLQRHQCCLALIHSANHAHIMLS